VLKTSKYITFVMASFARLVVSVHYTFYKWELAGFVVPHTRKQTKFYINFRNRRSKEIRNSVTRYAVYFSPMNLECVIVCAEVG
jgi:hypothetical protein